MFRSRSPRERLEPVRREIREHLSRGRLANAFPLWERILDLGADAETYEELLSPLDQWAGSGSPTRALRATGCAEGRFEPWVRRLAAEPPLHAARPARLEGGGAERLVGAQRSPRALCMDARQP